MMRKLAQCILDELGAPEEVVADIQLALTEACANAVRHAAGAEDYEVHLTVEEQSCEIEVIDLGPGFVPSQGSLPQGLGQLANHHGGPALESESGRGLMVMQALVDDLEFVANDEGTRVRLHKSWSPTPAEVGS